MGQPPRQLAFAWAPAGEAQPAPSAESRPAPAPDATAALTTDLMEEVVAAANVQRALARVTAKQGSPGIDGMTVNELAAELAARWPTLRAQLLAGEYRPQPVKRVRIPKPGGGERELGIPTVLDRLIQQAVLQVLTPLYDPSFSPHSYGYRPGKSAQQAVVQARAYVAAGYSWAVHVDLERFFDRVNHDVLMGRLARQVGDKRLLRLVRRYLEAGVLLNGVVVATAEGTPQGGPLSPLLSNVLLDEWDQELERRGHRFCRYADDCMIFVQSERAGARVLASTGRWLERVLRLRVNGAKSTVSRPAEQTFLGFRLVAGAAGVQVRIAPERLARAKATIRGITRRYRGVRFAQVVAELGRYTDGWVVYYGLAATPWVFQHLDGWIRRRLRCYLWVQWKTPQRRVALLRRAGVDRIQAYGLAYDGPGLWRAAHTPALDKALNNRTLGRLGYHSLLDRYRALGPG
jgi:RNA-directed DNA polymerase